MTSLSNPTGRHPTSMLGDLPDPLDTVRSLRADDVLAALAGDRLDEAVMAATDEADRWRHTTVHTVAQPGCPWCPPVETCAWCGRVAGACPDLAGHGRLARGSEVSWR